MTTTEPDLLLAQVEHREASAEREPTWLGLAGRALLGSFLAVLLSVGLSLITFEGSYAGAHDEATAVRAVNAYQPFLEMVARELGWIGLAEALGLAPLVLGLLLLLRVHRRSASWFTGRAPSWLAGVASSWLASALAGCVPALLGLLGVFGFFAGVAHRHPGLFLSILASSRVLTFSARWGHIIGVLVLGGSAVGYAATIAAAWRERRVQIACALALLGVAAAWLASSKLRGPERVFRNWNIEPVAAASPRTRRTTCSF